jgi:hypothetical protein
MRSEVRSIAVMVAACGVGVDTASRVRWHELGK